MSTFEAKVEVVYDFLANRASLKRLTNGQEVATVAGYTLKNRQLRRIDDPVKRNKITKVLAAVDRKSFAEKGVLLSVVVAHFWDNEVSRHFYERAQGQGVKVGGYGSTGIEGYRRHVFAVYEGDRPVSQKPAPKPIVREFASFEEQKADAARRSGNSLNLGNGFRAERGVDLDANDELAQIGEDLAKVTRNFNEYVGRHRRAEVRV